MLGVAIFGGGKFSVQIWLSKGRTGGQEAAAPGNLFSIPNVWCLQVLALVARWLSPLWLVLTPSRRHLQTCDVIAIKLYLAWCIYSVFNVLWGNSSAQVLCTTPMFDAPLRVHQHHPTEHPLAATSQDMHTNTVTLIPPDYTFCQTWFR